MRARSRTPTLSTLARRMVTVTLDTLAGLAEAARNAAAARRSELEIDANRKIADELDRTEEQAADALCRLIGAHDADLTELTRTGGGWAADIAGLLCRLDTTEHIARWRPTARICAACQRDTAGPVLMTVADLGDALEHEGPWPHDCHRPAYYLTSGWRTAPDLATWLTQRTGESPALEVVQIIADVDDEAGAFGAFVKIPARTVRADVDGFWTRPSGRKVGMADAPQRRHGGTVGPAPVPGPG